jgi:hypothetical protein
VKTDSLTLIPTTEFSGVAAFSGDRQKGVGYYKRTSSSQTVRFRTDDFAGTITIQASLDTDPTQDSEWFDVYTFPGDSSQDGSTAISSDFSTSLTGNFVWLRATVSAFAGGTITGVTLTY